MAKGISFGVVAVMIGAMSLMGCKKQVPTDIVQKSLRNALRLHAPLTTSGMCGANVKGLINANVTNVVRKPDGVTGTAHVSGAPWTAPGAPRELRGRRRVQVHVHAEDDGLHEASQTTTTTWFLDRVKLTAVQTKGVVFKSIDENSSDDDDEN